MEKESVIFRRIAIVILSAMFVTVIVLSCLAVTKRNERANEDTESLQQAENDIETVENDETQEETAESEPPEPIEVSVDIEEYYNKRLGDPGNLYVIDDNQVLWGSGENSYGQLGQGTQGFDFYSEPLKIAENVIHVDFSQRSFMIYLTSDGKLYGVGNSGSGALQQYKEFDWDNYRNNAYDCTVTTPVLLMEDVAYACCGRNDVVALKTDGTVWTWGTVWRTSGYAYYYIYMPKKILENAVWVTGGWFNHAALCKDGTVWTWGYNSSGNCGVPGLEVVRDPTLVAENVTMVWTNISIPYTTCTTHEEMVQGWLGKLKYDDNYENIADIGDMYPHFLNNTVIQKADGSFWVCGEHVGTEEKVVPGQEGEYTVVCTSDFYPVSDEDEE